MSASTPTVQPVLLDDDDEPGRRPGPGGDPAPHHALGPAVVAVLLVLLAPPLGAQLSPAGDRAGVPPVASVLPRVLSLPGTAPAWGGPDVQERRGAQPVAGVCAAP